MAFCEYFSFNLLSHYTKTFSNVCIVILAVISVRVGSKIEIISNTGRPQLLLLLYIMNSKIWDLYVLCISALSHLPCVDKALGSILIMKNKEKPYLFCRLNGKTPVFLQII